MKKLLLLLIITFNTNFINAQWQTDSIGSMCIAASNSNVFIGRYDGVFLSINNGSTWTPINNGLQADSNICTLTINGATIFAGTYHGGVFYSANNGGLWTATNAGLPNQRVNSIAINGTDIFVGMDSGGVFLSTNNGGLWTAVNNGLINSQVNTLAISGANIFAGTNRGIFLSTNNGGLWTPINNGITDTIVSSLAISGNNILAGTNAYNSNSGGVFFSSNNGTSWTAVNNGLTNTHVSSLALSGTNIFVGLDDYGTANGGVFLSTNNGGLWTAINTGLPYLGIWSLAINTTNIFALVVKPPYTSLQTEVWQRLLFEVTGINEKNSKSHFLLFPNPTTGKYKVEGSDLTISGLEVYNIFGEKVFQSSNLNQLSSYEIDLSLSPKGIYFVKICDGTKIHTEKIFVL